MLSAVHSAPGRQGSARGKPLAITLGGLMAVAALAGCDVSEDSDLDRGRALFQAQCGTCHALAQAGTSATVGPDLDASFAQARADGMDNDTIEGVVQAQIGNPRQIAEDDPEYERTFMPADLVVGQDAEDVAAYVASVAGVPGAAPPPLGTPEAVFQEKCGSCHTLAAAGTAGQVGPVLDDVLGGQSVAEITESIRDPSAKLASGFGDLMPAFDEGQVPEADLRKLVQYLIDSVGDGG